ncbi:flavodoxin family protein [Microbulbifer variabilis]|uniref:flavodoxin family protein n=1 Tax=Microbulbifer variabilis TaxID=266805 RepID=UPI001CFF342E|nr:flavodoxin family protein [Microbulbifer variabilis]
MIKVGVVYHSVCGSTRTLAEAIVDGINSIPGCEGEALAIKGEHIIQGRYHNPELMLRLDQCNGIVFGSPTFMGSVSAQFKAFMDAASERYSGRGWVDKLSAGFTIGSNFSGDQLNTISTLQIFAAQMGMLWVPLGILPNHDVKRRNRSGCQSGLVAVVEGEGTVHELDYHTALYMGERIGQLLGRLQLL